MRIQEIRALAKKRGINSGRMGKADLIRAIQRDEGNFECYGTAVDGYCDQGGCAWRRDCHSESATLR
ncbi:MAG: Rho termination factor N-terminal domain-containing protein [Deltaproteobacteria bacterium]|nr:Rho termination factor N-terminal domain-containing protein [Deltaproteobacteria bacterium]